MTANEMPRAELVAVEKRVDEVIAIARVCVKTTSHHAHDVYNCPNVQAARQALLDAIRGQWSHGFDAGYLNGKAAEQAFNAHKMAAAASQPSGHGENR